MHLTCEGASNVYNKSTEVTFEWYHHEPFYRDYCINKNREVMGMSHELMQADEAGQSASLHVTQISEVTEQSRSGSHDGINKGCTPNPPHD